MSPLPLSTYTPFPVIFPGWDYDAYHHPHEMHSHFSELREKWERTRDAIP